MRSHYFVTTPIYYVNAVPHIGHAYTSVAADVLARFQRLEGREVFLLTGTDEHGQKVEKAALDAAVEPQTYVDRLASEFRSVAEMLHVSFDDFIRTTQPRHVQTCQMLWRRLREAGQIYLGSYTGWYSVRDEAFYGEDELVRRADGSLAAPTGSSVDRVSEPSYFFRLSDWSERLLQLYDDQPNFVGPAGSRNEVLSFVRSGLRDLSISRTSSRWGIAVPDDPEHVMYVWFDALANYLSALGWDGLSVPPGGEWSAFWPPSLHLIGKEIVRFHAVYWPAMLMAAGIALPERVFSHGWWLVEGEKMSKSAGNGLDPRDLVREFGVDPIRYFLLREVPFGRDGDFTRRALIARTNNELADDLGNLAQRSLVLLRRHCQSSLPPIGERTDDDLELFAAACRLPGRVRLALGDYAFSDALESVWEVVRAANAYIDRQAPWKLSKSDHDRLGVVLRVLVDTLRVIGTVLQPFMPASMARLLDQVGVPRSDRIFAGLERTLREGTQLPQPEPIFPKVLGVSSDG